MTEGIDLVVAARVGDRRALAELNALHLPLVYNVAGRALRVHADIEHAVRRTFARSARELAQLRDPDRFRGWLLALTVREVAGIQAAGTGVSAALDGGAPDPTTDFVGLGVVQHGLTGRRRELDEATRWIDGEYSVVLALWWLEAAGLLSRAEVAEALRTPPDDVNGRVTALREQWEQARTLVGALRAQPACPELTAITDGWDRLPAPAWRRGLGLHVGDCPVCATATRDLPELVRLLADHPLVPVPGALVTALTADGIIPADAGKTNPLLGGTPAATPVRSSTAGASGPSAGRPGAYSAGWGGAPGTPAAAAAAAGSVATPPAARSTTRSGDAGAISAGPTVELSAMAAAAAAGAAGKTAGLDLAGTQQDASGKGSATGATAAAGRGGAAARHTASPDVTARGGAAHRPTASVQGTAADAGTAAGATARHTAAPGATSRTAGTAGAAGAGAAGAGAAGAGAAGAGAAGSAGAGASGSAGRDASDVTGRARSAATARHTASSGSAASRPAGAPGAIGAVGSAGATAAGQSRTATGHGSSGAAAQTTGRGRTDPGLVRPAQPGQAAVGGAAVRPGDAPGQPAATGSRHGSGTPGSDVAAAPVAGRAARPDRTGDVSGRASAASAATGATAASAAPAAADATDSGPSWKGAPTRLPSADPVAEDKPSWTGAPTRIPVTDAPTSMLPTVSGSGSVKGSHPRETPPKGVRAAVAGDTVAIPTSRAGAVVPRQRGAVPPAAEDGSTAVIPRVPLAVTASGETAPVPAEDRDTGVLAGVILPGDQFVPSQTASRHIPPPADHDDDAGILPVPVEAEERQRGGRSRAVLALAGVAAAVVALSAGALVINNAIDNDDVEPAAAPIGAQGQYVVPPAVESSAASASPSPSPSPSASASKSASPSPSAKPSPSKTPSAAASSPAAGGGGPAVALQSLRLASDAGRYVRASGGGVTVERLSAGSPAAARQEASFEVVAGLANSGCVSLRTPDGRYLRHYDYRIRASADDGSALFKADATFCMQQAGGATMLRSHNYPDNFLRVRDSALYIGTPDRQSASSMLWVLTDGLAG